MSKEDQEVLEERIREAGQSDMKQAIKKIRNHGKQFHSDFKKFITRGNVIDLAVALVIGSAFNKIVNGLVNFIIMPAVGFFTNGITMTDWKWWIIKPDYDEAGAIVDGTGLAILYGSFLETIFNFLIIALTIFVALRIIRRAKSKIGQREEEKKRAEEAKAAAETKQKAEAAAEAARIAAEEAARKEAEQEASYRASVEQTELLRQILARMRNN